MTFILECLGKPSNQREYRCLCENPPIIVHTYQSDELSSNSSVSMSSWDKFAKLNTHDDDQFPHMIPTVEIDFLPFFVDNHHLTKTQQRDLLLCKIIRGEKTSMCGKM